MDFFAWGGYGGYGYSARTLAKELVRQGVEVTVITPRHPGQMPVERLDGVRVLAFDDSVWGRLKSIQLYRSLRCDLYVFWGDPVFVHYLLGLLFAPGKRFVLLQDPWTKMDWVRAFQRGILRPNLPKRMYVLSLQPLLVRICLRRADEVAIMHTSLKDKARVAYGIKPPERELRAIAVNLPTHDFKKSESPVVCYVARWDRVKGLDNFVALARSFPSVKFIAIGKALERGPSKLFFDRAKEVKNLDLRGFVSESEKLDLLEKSWVLVSPSYHEGVPFALIEALSRRCAILSTVNPGGIVERFGFWARDGDLESGLRFLLESNKWLNLGKEGQEYVKKEWEMQKVARSHVTEYSRLLGGQGEHSRN